MFLEIVGFVYIVYIYPSIITFISAIVWLPLHLIATRTLFAQFFMADFGNFIGLLYLTLRFRQNYDNLKHLNKQGK